LEESTASNFRVKEEAKQVVSKREAAGKVSFETLLNFYQTALHYITEDNTLHY
jgi:hypothetical protein